MREERRHRDSPAKPPRTEFQRDKERVLHASALRRLAGVSQVVAAHEGHVFHNRLTHVLKVAQIGRGLAEVLLHNKDTAAKAQLLGGLNPDVVETAALSHDLGHPPFGHIAEHELDELVKKDANLPEGFEGNAQSFRVVTKLAVRTEDHGLNLTRASLNSVLKYPWFRQTDGKKQRKWGAYHTEDADFEWARQGYPDDRKSLEAELMDWADDIAYSVFDLDDFYRAGKIPLDRVFISTSLSSEAEIFLKETERRFRDSNENFDLKEARGIVGRFANFNTIKEPYNGSREQRAALRSFTSTLIKRYMHDCVRLPENQEGPRLIIDEKKRKEVSILKQLTWGYVIDNPSLTTQQYGYRTVVKELFTVFMDAAGQRCNWNMFPRGVKDLLESSSSDNERTRIVVDTIASMTEQQALEMYQRLKGISFGSVLKSVM